MRKSALTVTVVALISVTAVAPALAQGFGDWQNRQNRARTVPASVAQPGFRVGHDAKTGQPVQVRTPKSLAECNRNAKKLHGEFDRDGNNPQCKQAFPGG